MSPAIHNPPPACHPWQPPAPQPWMSHAACVDHDPDLWYPDTVTARTDSDAALICRGCPVRAECLTYALEHRETHGIWGGLTPAQRDNHTAHGTERGYRRHLTDRTRPCRPCRRAHADQRRAERGNPGVNDITVQRAIGGGGTPEPLTTGEKREAVRRLRAHGHTAQAIADRLGVTVRSVERHIAALRQEAS